MAYKYRQEITVVIRANKKITKAEAAKIFADSIYGEFYPYEGNTKNRADEFKIVSPKIKGVF
jgi:hypothetical protein|tara:strand:+ start:279 stop:464 length:186 start_codon:yes stop_codon:yes gene_type:complete